jgi:hypothetical protein
MKPSALKREHPALQNLLLWVIFALPDPYSEYGSGSKTLFFFLPYGFLFSVIFFLKRHAEYFASKKLNRIFFFWKKILEKNSFVPFL